MLNSKPERTTRNIVANLNNRSIGRSSFRYDCLDKGILKRVDSSLNRIADNSESLRTSLKKSKTGFTADIKEAVEHLISDLLMPAGGEQAFEITPLKKQERETFVLIGGFDLLLQFLGNRNPKKVQSSQFRVNSNIWDEILVILREISFAIPTLADRLFSTEHIIFLFNLLRQKVIFENTMNLLEEVLSSRTDTFNLGLVPGFHDLLHNFSSREMAHFCRLLSLVLFEPEDRLIMEGSQVITSLELLQLRRDRMGRTTSIVETNQHLVSMFDDSQFFIDFMLSYAMWAFHDCFRLWQLQNSFQELCK